jgi:site-specific recombinase XerD
MAKSSGKKHRGVYEYPVGSDVWWVCYFCDGCGRHSHRGRHREKAGGKQAAINRYQQRKTEAREGRLPTPHRNVAFDAFTREYLETARVRLRSYPILLIYARRWIEYFGARPLRSILPLMIERYIAEREQNVAPATVNRELAFVKRVFAVAVENGLLERNPAKPVKFLREPSGRVRFLSDEEEIALCAAVGEKKWTPIAFALNTGLRRGEQFNLRWEHVNLANRVLTVPRSKHGGTRHVQLNDTAMSILRSLPSRFHSRWVFPNATAKGPISANNFRYRVFDPAIERAKIEDFTWHDLRHTFASRLVMRGADLRSVQELLGHKTLTMTLRYAHLSPTHLHQAVKLLDSGGTVSGSSTAHSGPSRVTHPAGKGVKS